MLSVLIRDLERIKTVSHRRLRFENAIVRAWAFKTNGTFGAQRSALLQIFAIPRGAVRVEILDCVIKSLIVIVKKFKTVLSSKLDRKFPSQRNP